jgi:hypothetical protein
MRAIGPRPFLLWSEPLRQETPGAMELAAAPRSIVS